MSLLKYRFIHQNPLTQLLKNNRLLFHGDLDHLIPIVHQLFFVYQEGMVDGLTGDLFNLGKGQLEAVLALFFNPDP